MGQTARGKCNGVENSGRETWRRESTWNNTLSLSEWTDKYAHAAL